MSKTKLDVNKLNMALKRIALILLILFSVACTKSNDKPPHLDTPLPQAHRGLYKSSDATFSFSGDGKTVLVELSDNYLNVLDNPPNNTAYFYTFTWYAFGEYRYDGATNLILYHEDTQTSINFNLVEASSFERISISFPVPNKDVQVLQRIIE